MATVKCNWSGGKDSSCATHLHLTQGDKCIVVNYIPMFTKEIPMLLKVHYEFIMQTAEKFRQMGAEVYQPEGINYWDFVHLRNVKGDNKGRIKGFPPFITGACNFKTFSKEKALNSLDKKLNYDYQDIGIAFDEKKRHNQLSEKKRSILVEKKIAEHGAVEYCKRNGIYSPHYSILKRDGCSLCPQAPTKERIMWFRDYPDAFDLVLELQNFVKKERPEQTPLRNYKWFIEEDLQMNMFDKGTRWIIN